MDWRTCYCSRHREEHLGSYSTNAEELVESHIGPELVVLVDIEQSDGVSRVITILTTDKRDGLIPLRAKLETTTIRHIGQIVVKNA